MTKELPKRITIRATEEFHRAVKAKALEEGTTLQAAITVLLEKWLEEKTGRDNDGYNHI